jgi:hypothetical protein
VTNVLFVVAVVAVVIGLAIAALVIGYRFSQYLRARRGPASEPRSEAEPDDVW